MMPTTSTRGPRPLAFIRRGRFVFAVHPGTPDREVQVAECPDSETAGFVLYGLRTAYRWEPVEEYDADPPGTVHPKIVTPD